VNAYPKIILKIEPNGAINHCMVQLVQLNCFGAIGAIFCGAYKGTK